MNIDFGAATITVNTAGGLKLDSSGRIRFYSGATLRGDIYSDSLYIALIGSGSNTALIGSDNGKACWFGTLQPAFSTYGIGTATNKVGAIYGTGFYDDGVLITAPDILDDLYIMSQYDVKKEVIVDPATGSKIKGEPLVHPISGGNILDIHSIPRWMTNYDEVVLKLKHDNGDLITDEDIEEYMHDINGAEWMLCRNVATYGDMTSGALRQLDVEMKGMFELLAGRITALENKSQTQTKG
jgi:hypothetical protein